MPNTRYVTYGVKTLKSSLVNVIHTAFHKAVNVSTNAKTSQIQNFHSGEVSAGANGVDMRIYIIANKIMCTSLRTTPQCFVFLKLSADI